MANLRETGTWEEGIYQWETSDPVMGGEDGIDNRPTRQLANRTRWLKTEAARLDRLIGTNLNTVNQGLAGKVDKTTQITAGAGLTGGGTLGGSIQIQMGTPGKLNGTTTNWVGSNTHTHEIDKATATLAGVVKLIDNLTAGGRDAALSAEQGKALKQLIDAGVGNAVPYAGATKHVDLNGKNLTNAGEVKLGDGRNSGYQQLVLGNYERAAGQGNYGAVFNGKFAGGSARWTTLSTFGEDGNHISSLFADATKAYLRVGSTNHELATKGTTFAHYGIAGNQELIGGRLTIKGREYPSLALQSTLGNSDLWLESSGSRHYFIRRGRGQTAGGDILYLPDRAGTLVTLGTTLAHYGITDAASKAELRNIVRTNYNRSITPPLSGGRAVTVDGHTFVYPDGRIVQVFHLKNISLVWLDAEDPAVGQQHAGGRGRQLILPLWTAMPQAVVEVRPQVVRATGQSSQTYAAEATEWIYAWSLRKQGAAKNQVVVDFNRIGGGTDELVDMYIVVEGY